MSKIPLFYGLSHIGQVFSILWSKKIGPCSVFDDNKFLLKKFEEKDFTNEEPDLKKINKKKAHKINIIKNKDLITKYNTVFFTIDTPLDFNGNPKIKDIENELKKLILLCKRKTKIIFLSQVFPGFLNEFYKKNKKINKKKIEIIYMVDTLKMGEAINKFLKPKQLIFGISNKNNIFFLKKLFKYFKCEKFFFSHTEAEIIKMSINLYLAFSVSFANTLDFFCNEFNFSFSKILNPLKNDNRIGKESYIYPSLGLSGGHLERDMNYISNISKNTLVKKIFFDFKKLSNARKKILLDSIKKNCKSKKIYKVLIFGVSYKETSFSIINSIFSEIFKDKNKFSIEVFDSKFLLENNRFYKVSNDIKKSLKNNYIYIYNYLDTFNKNILINYLKNNKNKFLINLNKNETDKFKNFSNCKNIFDVPNKSIINY
jgi:UDPglucose 6-dehydrogenase